MRRRALLIVAAGLMIAAVIAGLRPGADAAPGADAVRVLVATSAIPAGRPIDPALLAVVLVPAQIAPEGALTEPDQAAFRSPAVRLPAGMPLYDALLARGAGVASLAADERAVGVRVDDVTGLPGFLDVGARVDVLVGSGSDRLAIESAGVLGRPRRSADGGWAVALRLPAALATAVADAQSAGAEVRLLARGSGS